MLEAARRPPELRCLPQSAQASGARCEHLRRGLRAMPCGTRYEENSGTRGSGLSCGNEELRLLPHAEIHASQSALFIHGPLDKDCPIGQALSGLDHRIQFVVFGAVAGGLAGVATAALPNLCIPN